MKKGDRVLIDTSAWSSGGVQRFRIERIGQESIGGTWETGELEGKAANIHRSHLRVVESLPPTPK